MYVIIGDTDLDGIARAAAILSAVPEWSNAKVIIRFSRKLPSTKSSTLADALRTYIKDEAPEGSTVLYEDIPVNVLKPKEYIEALKEFCGTRTCIWSDHHETDKQFLDDIKEAIAHGKVCWIGPSAYRYTLDLVEELGGDRETAEKYAILAAIGDRDRAVLKVLDREELAEWLKIADGMDVMIREISAKNDPADYADLVRRLATDNTIFEEAKKYADRIPTPKNVLVYGNVALVKEELPPAWGPKALERAAFNAGTEYAIGITKNPRDGTYAIRAITYWLSDAQPIGAREEFKAWLQVEGKKSYGPPAAPVIPGYATFEEAMMHAEMLVGVLTSKIGTRVAQRR